MWRRRVSLVRTDLGHVAFVYAPARFFYGASFKTYDRFFGIAFIVVIIGPGPRDEELEEAMLLQDR